MLLAPKKDTLESFTLDLDVIAFHFFLDDFNPKTVYKF